MISVRSILCLILVIQFDLVTGQEFETINGRVRGKRMTIMGKSLDIFHGIPFAKPPLGHLRFQHPKPADPWKPEVKNATTETSSCVQPLSPLHDLLPADDPRHLTRNISEDCLYLSIWKPSSAAPGSNKAVMVWIYGGGFVYGATNQPLYSGQYLAAEHDVIVVSINYRLGPLGFAFLSPGTIPGNAGLMDQIEGMKWVKNNIENFGGDKNRITVFGESSGSYSIGHHLVSPLSRDLFHRAIMQSGVHAHTLTEIMLSGKGEARATLKRLSEMMKCSGSSDVDIHACMMDADVSTIMAAFDKLRLTGARVVPVEDGYFLPDDPIDLIDRGEQMKVDILTGVTKEEFSLSLMFYLNPATKVIYATGETFSQKDFEHAITMLTRLTDKARNKAIKIFYESEWRHPVNHLEAVNHAGSDILFRCPTLLFSSLYAKTNDVYLYSLNYRVSNMPLPAWMGVPHSYDLDLVFGMPFNNSLGYNDQDREISRNMMTYWTNFAKTGYDYMARRPLSQNWNRKWSEFWES